MFILLIATVLACENLQSQLTIYPTVLEQMRWDLTTLFNGQALQYRLSLQQEDYQIISSFQPQESIKHVDDVEQIISLTALKQNSNHAWTNIFAFVEQDQDSVDIFYTSQSTTNTPSFDKVLRISDLNPLLRCFGIEFLIYGIFIVDCGVVDSKNAIENKFYISSIDGKSIEVDNDNLKNIVTIKHRSIATAIRKDQFLLFRASFEEDGTSFIESFRINKDYTNLFNNLYLLDNISISKYLNIENAKFTLLDFHVTSNCDIYVLDKIYGLFIVQLSNSYQWNIIQHLQPVSEQYIAFYTSLVLEQNGIHQRFILLLLKNRVLLYKDTTYWKTITLPIEIKGNAKISLAGEFLLLSYKSTFYQYNIKTSNYLYSNSLEVIAQYLVNPYLPDVVGISTSFSHRYYLSNGSLQLLPNSKITTIEKIDLIGTDSEGECKIEIFSQRLSRNDKNLYKLNNHLPSVVSSPSEPFVLQDIVSGPDQSYSQRSESGSNVQIQDLWDMHINIEFPNAQFLQVGSTIYQDDYLYLLFQTQDTGIMIWKCEEKTMQDLNCKEWQAFKLEVLLTQSTFTWWLNDDDFKLSYLEGQHNLIIQNGKEQTIQQNVTSTNIIKQFLVMDEYVYLLTEMEIICYSSFFPIEEKTILNQEWINTQGFEIQWAPKKVFGNRLVNKNLLFVHNENQILIFDTHKGFTLIKSIQLQDKKQEVFVGVNQYTFFLLQKGYLEFNLIEEYSLENLNDIYLMKELPLFDQYILTSPMQVEYGVDNGYLFVRVYSYKSQKTEILVYRPNELAHNCLRKIIEINQFIEEGKSLILSASGLTDMYVYVNANGKQSIKSLLQQPLMVIEGDLENNDYVQKSNLKLSVNNKFKVNQIDLEQNITILNTFTTINMDVNKLRDDNHLYLESEDTTHILNDNWFQGQVINFDIQCKEQLNNAKMRNKIVKTNNQQIIIKDHQLQSYIQFNKLLNLIQGQRQLIFMDNQDQINGYINLELPFNYVCTQCAVNDDKTIIYSLCSDGSQQNIHVTICNDIDCFPLGLKYKIELHNVSKIGIIGQQLIMLNADLNNKFIGDIRMYKIINQWELVDEIIFNARYFNTSIELYFTDFQINVFGTQIYIIMLDAFRIIASVSGKLQDQYLVLSSRQFSDLKYLISKSEQFYLKDDTQFLALQYLSYTQNMILNINMLLITNNAPQFGIRLIFDSVLQIVIDYGLNQYGSWQCSHLVLYSKGYVILHYYSMFKQFVAIYKVPQTSQQQLQRIHAGIQYENMGQNVFYYLSGSLKLYSLEQNNLIRYDVYDNLELYIKGDTHRQKCTLTGESDFYQESTDILLDRYFDKDNSNLWWIILISVVTLVIIVVVCFYLYKRKYPKKVFNIQLLED